MLGRTVYCWLLQSPLETISVSPCQALQKVRAFLSLKLDYDTNGSENFLLDDLHIRLSVREDGRLDEIALLAVSLPTNVNRRAVLFSGLDIFHDALVVDSIDQSILDTMTLSYFELDL